MKKIFFLCLILLFTKIVFAQYKYDNGEYSISNSNIKSNSFNYNGGAIDITNTAKLTVSSCTFEDNSTWFLTDENNTDGGAIYNSGILYMNKQNYSTFYNNHTAADSKVSKGGAIYNGKNAKATIYATFNNNFSRQGGAIFNAGNLEIFADENVDFYNFSSNGANAIEEGGIYYGGNGGAICNISTVTTGNKVSFYNNMSSLAGGAIFSTNGELNIGDNNFFLENASKDGGAIYASSGTVNISNEVFFSTNTALGHGGAICNTYDSQIISGNSNLYVLNTANSGGAIYNDGTFGLGQDNDYVTYFSSNTAKSVGGAISNSKNFIATNIVYFHGNKSENQEENISSVGGAIYNTGLMSFLSYSAFTSNSADIGGSILSFSPDETEDIGIMFNKATGFENNIATNMGGAITNSGNSSIIFVDGAVFKNNIAGENGGAIYNEKGTILLIANKEDVIFEGNTANGESNAIYDDGGTIILRASSKANITLNDKLVSKDNTSELIINETLPRITTKEIDGKIYYIDLDPITKGKIVLNEDMSSYTGTVNLCGGTIKLGEKGTLFGGDYNIKHYAVIDMANKIIQEHKFNNLTADYRFDLIVDADLENKQMDTIFADSYTGPTIHINAINITNDTEETKRTILFTSSTVLKDKIASIDTVSSKLYKYDVSYNDGYFNFINVSNKINPILAESAIASSVGGFTTQTNVLGQAFSSLDTQISNRKLVKKQGTLYASTANSIFDMENKIERGLWIRPYAMQETIKFNDIDVDNTAIGTLAGIDLAAGENGLLSFYLGYIGSNQKYEDIKVNQTGYIVGATGMRIKENYYLGLTANINFNKAESETVYGTDNFDMNMYSIGAKAGYNFDLSDKWILEPNLMLMYGNIVNQEYETKQGAKIDSQSTANIIVEPQVKAKLSLDNGWQPYGLLGYVANISDKAKIVVDGAEFETDKINGYVEYGAGVNKDFLYTPWSCYVQVTGRSGGRNGFAGNLGIKYKF